MGYREKREGHQCGIKEISLGPEQSANTLLRAVMTGESPQKMTAEDRVQKWSFHRWGLQMIPDVSQAGMGSPTPGETLASTDSLAAEGRQQRGALL